MDRIHSQAKVGFDNSPYLQILYWPFVRSDGQAGIQSRVRVLDGVAVIALDEENHKVYVIRQVRESLEGDIVTIEPPGGGIKPGGTSLEAAKEELREEAQALAISEEDWISLYPREGINPIDGLVLTRQHAFLCLRARKDAELPCEEGIQVCTMPLSKLIAMDDQNMFHDPLFPYALRRAQAWLEKHRPDLLT